MNELLIPEVIFAFLSENSSTEISKPPDGAAGIHLPAQHGSKSTQVSLPVCNEKRLRGYFQVLYSISSRSNMHSKKTFYPEGSA